jgi:signal transduction histidine kinase
MFIPFFSTRKTGSGIGLSLCKQIMMLHKGTIQVQSVEGEGSAFLLYF